MYMYMYVLHSAIHLSTNMFKFYAFWPGNKLLSQPVSNNGITIRGIQSAYISCCDVGQTFGKQAFRLLWETFGN